MLWLMSIRCSSGNSAHFFWLSATGLGASEALMNRLSVLTGRLRSIAFISSSRLSSDVSSEGLQRDCGTGFMNQSSADVRRFRRLSSCSGVGFCASAMDRVCVGEVRGSSWRGDSDGTCTDMKGGIDVRGLRPTIRRKARHHTPHPTQSHNPTIPQSHPAWPSRSLVSPFLPSPHPLPV